MPCAVVAGASRGIGLALTRALSATHEVYATCRTPADDLKQLQCHVVPGACTAAPQGVLLHACNERVTFASLRVSEPQRADVDTGIDGGCDTLAAAIAALQIDLLVLNAGVFAGDTLEALDFSAMRHQFEVNALGPLRVVAALRSKLSRGSKVVLIGSWLGSLACNGEKGARVRRVGSGGLGSESAAGSTKWGQKGAGRRFSLLHSMCDVRSTVTR